MSSSCGFWVFFRLRWTLEFFLLNYRKFYGRVNAAIPLLFGALLLKRVIGEFLLILSFKKTFVVLGAFPWALTIESRGEFFEDWNTLGSFHCDWALFEPIGIGLFTICTWGYNEAGLSTYLGLTNVSLSVTFCIRRLSLFLIASVSYFGVCRGRTNKWKVAPSIVLTKPKWHQKLFEFQTLAWK